MCFRYSVHSGDDQSMRSLPLYPMSTPISATVSTSALMSVGQIQPYVQAIQTCSNVVDSHQFSSYSSSASSFHPSADNPSPYAYTPLLQSPMLAQDVLQSVITLANSLKESLQQHMCEVQRCASMIDSIVAGASYDLTEQLDKMLG